MGEGGPDVGVIAYGDVFDTVDAAVAPSDPAVICDGETLGWGEFRHRTNALARRFLAAGLAPGDRVALYMRNSPDHLASFVAAFKARLAPVNVNYRYGVDEITHILDNSDARIVVFDADYAPVVEAASARLPCVRLWIAAGGTAAGAEPMSQAWRGDGAPLGLPRSPADAFFLYTGGTTGLPKGVIWPGGVWWRVLAAGRSAVYGEPPPETLAALSEQIRSGARRAPVYVAPPIMHGTGLFTAMGALSKGAPVVISRSVQFQPDIALDAMSDNRCGGLAIVGDAFGRPLVNALRKDPERYDLSAMRTVTSSGMMWSPEVKEALLEFMPDAMLFDSFGASEGTGLGAAITTRATPAREAVFEAPNTIVVRADDFSPIPPGSGEVGLVAKAGDLPLGYHKDPEKTARTWVVIDGVRRLLSGDHATVEADGRIRLLGRGSHCINSGGEKIYPEEVEEALKSHPAVADALVFGRPDERFGQAVAAVVELDGGAILQDADLIAFVRNRLAAYKAPRRIRFIAKVPRAPNGKPDYPRAREMFEG